MPTSFAYRLACKILSAVAIVARRDVSSEAELLVLRMSTPCCVGT